MSIPLPDVPVDWARIVNGLPSTPTTTATAPAKSGGGGQVYMGKVRVSSPTRTIVPIPVQGRGVMRHDGETSGAQRRGQSRITGRELRAVDHIVDTALVRGRVYEWYGTDDLAKWARHLVRIGLIDEDEQNDIAVLDEVWQKVLDYAEKFTAAGKRLDPFQVAELIARSGGGRGLRSGRGGGFSGTKKHVSREVDLTDPETAKAIVHDVLSQALGRRANDEELEQFRNALNAYERANPRVTTTTTTYRDGDAVSSSSTTTGGVTQAGRQEMLLEEAMELPEYGAYQAASTYMNALFSAIQSPV